MATAAAAIFNSVRNIFNGTGYEEEDMDLDENPGEGSDRYSDSGTGTESERFSGWTPEQEVQAGAGVQKELRIRANTQLKVLIFQPYQLGELPEIADELRAMKTVILNLSRMGSGDGQRMLDSLGGVAYMLDANILPVARRTYMFLPYNVDYDVTSAGDIRDQLNRSGFFMGGALDLEHDPGAADSDSDSDSDSDEARVGWSAGAS